MSLREYQRKRKFNQTPEPPGKTSRGAKNAPLRFVVQLHHATRTHYDFRLEFDGVLKSWAVPKGPSLNPLDQRLAVFVEDHPIEYGSFEGIIPRGNYGAGTVMLWDRGTFYERSSPPGAEGRRPSVTALLAGLAKGHITFVLDGEKLRGEFALIRLKRGGDDRNWLLVKKRDEFSSYKIPKSDVDRSVATGRTMAEIAAGAEAKGEVWFSGREVSEQTAPLHLPHAKAKNKSRAPEPLPPPRRSFALPRRVAPMLPVHAASAMEGDWIYEPFFGKTRAIAEIDHGVVRLYSRQFLPFERKFPRIAAALRKLKGAWVLDGEIEGGRFRVLDLLYGEGEDLRLLPLEERLRRLASLPLKFELVSGPRSENRATALQEATRLKAPSLLARDPASVYRSGITRDWLKIAVANAGGVPAPRAKGRETPARNPRPASVAAARNVRPKPIARASAAALAASPDDHTPRLTNLDKIYFPKAKITKGDLIEYYRSVAPELLPHLKDRPESMHRHPNGIGRSSFFQKDLTGYHPRWLETHRIHSESAGKTIDFLLCQDLRSLEYMANLGCIELNPWLSRVGSLDHPDCSIIDLDPDDSNDFRDVIAAALEVQRILQSIGVEGFCKTSGATGLHIAIPLAKRQDYDGSRELAHEICKKVHTVMPEVTSLERNPARRRGKIYLDFLQNRRGQTLAAPYCVRPREDAPVSTPLKWSEVKPGLDPTMFTIRNTRRRLDRTGDLWKPVLRVGIPVAHALKLLNKKQGRK